MMCIDALTSELPRPKSKKGTRVLLISEKKNYYLLLYPFIYVLLLCCLPPNKGILWYYINLCLRNSLVEIRRQRYMVFI